MQDSPFYHSSIRTIVAAFGTVFNELKIEKTIKGGIKVLPVPLRWGPKQHYYNALKRIEEKDNPKLSIDLPQMSYFLRGIQYNAANSINPLHRISNPTIQPDNTKKAVYNPAPYLFQFELSIYTNGSSDMYRILEQILPYFRPSINLTVTSVDVMDIEDNITITLIDSVEADDNWQSTNETNRLIEYTLSFEVSGHIYPAIRDTKLITSAIIDFENLCFEPPRLLETLSVDSDENVTIEPVPND